MQTSIPEIPATIKSQIGSQAFYMLGATNFMYDSKNPNYLSFRIRGSKNVNYVKITLNSLDLYDMEFGKIHGQNYKVVNSFINTDVSLLHKAIELNTGLYTSL